MLFTQEMREAEKVLWSLLIPNLGVEEEREWDDKHHATSFHIFLPLRIASEWIFTFTLFYQSMTYYLPGAKPFLFGILRFFEWLSEVFKEQLTRIFL